MERLVAPSPTSTTASIGSAAASPQIPTGLPRRAPAVPTSRTSLSTAGCHGSWNPATEPSMRSAAIVYCVRSFVPIDAKSACARIRSASRALDGISTMTPAVLRPYSRASAVKYSVSSTVATMGAMTHRSASVAASASASAVSCSRRMSSLARSARSPRRPSAGFSSCASLRKASGLSAPASSIRTTTFWPGKAASSSRYDSRCCSTVGAWADERNRNSVRNSPTPSAPRSTASDASAGFPRFASSGISVPSARAPGVSGAASAERRAAARCSARVFSSSEGSTVTIPAAASTMTWLPVTRSDADAAPTIATMPFSRARIAVCEVGPPSNVTRAST